MFTGGKSITLFTVVFVLELPQLSTRKRLLTEGDIKLTRIKVPTDRGGEFSRTATAQEILRICRAAFPFKLCLMKWLLAYIISYC